MPTTKPKTVPARIRREAARMTERELQDAERGARLAARRALQSELAALYRAEADHYRDARLGRGEG